MHTLGLIAGVVAGGLATIASVDRADAQAPGLTEKLNAYIACTNRLSARAYESRERYFSWAAKSGPTGKERIIYGLYTIYDTTDCAKGVEKANAMEPRVTDIEAAASEYVRAVVTLEPLLKEADDYYDQKNYKDDKMAKGRALHPKLVAAWTAFATADAKLRAGVDTVSDALAVEKLSLIEKNEGRNDRYHVGALMMHAKRLVRTQSNTPNDLPKVLEALAAYEAIVKETDAFVTARGKESKIGSSFVGSAKTFLASSKALMRRVRDKVPYSQGDRMMLNTGSGAWMVEGSPARLTRDYNQLIDSYNRGARF